MPTADREEALFTAALEKRKPAERAAYLEGACGGDDALRARIEALLAAHEAAGGVLDAPPGSLPLTTGYHPLVEGPGTIIGPYKLLQQIGEGGMGVVYMAEQQEPVRRKVALKIIKPGMDSHQVIARFEAERQALAMMDHQNIARVLDAGTTESGRPYFVMELVHGVPITKFCDDNKLTPRERLALFVPVCQAIQHAHQKGIIHRDVKPSNVLVTMYDDKPVPKVIDFGVAKAIEQRLTEKTMFTQFGALVGTFEYMSPEQAEMNAFGVDTRSDIYSLGVLLYELLTGTTPLERKRLREAAVDELVRLIKEEEAPRPSKRLSSSNNLPKIAAARKTEPARLSKLVRGEIDWIVMKCLEKDRSRRYDTASALARDLERYLTDEPVEACPPTARYRLGKFARKYKKVLATTGAFAVLLVAGVVISTVLAIWATSAEREANQQRIASDGAKQEALVAKGEADKQRDEVRLTAYEAGIGLAQRAWEENNVGRARELLAELPKEAAGKDLRGFEWYYLNRLCHSESLTLEGPDLGRGLRVAFSPDGQRLISANWQGVGGIGEPPRGKAVKTWDSSLGKELSQVFDFGRLGGFSGVALSPDGRRLVWRDGHSDLVFDGVTGKELFALKPHKPYEGVVHSLAVSPDGQRLASAGHERAVLIWDGVTGKELFALRGHEDFVKCVAFSPDGQHLASGSMDKTVRIWDSKTGKELFTLRGHADFVECVAFSPDGQRLASGSWDKTVRIWDTANYKEQFTLMGHDNHVVSVAFSPVGSRLASGSHDKTVKIWDHATGKELYALKGHARGVTSVAFSPDGQRLASGSDDERVKIWDCVSARDKFSIQDQHGLLSSVAFSPDGQRLASCGNDSVKIWDRATGKELLWLKGRRIRDSTSVAFSPDGRRLASACWGVPGMVWDSETGKELFSLSSERGDCCVAFSADGQRLATGGTPGQIRDSLTGKALCSLRTNSVGPIRSVAFSPDGQRLASMYHPGGLDNLAALTIWDSATGEELLSVEDPPVFMEEDTQEIGADPGSLAFSPDGERLASANRLSNTVRIRDPTTGEVLCVLKGHTGVVTGVAFSPDGRRLATASVDGTVRIWNTQTGRELLSLKGHAGPVFSVAFSPDGQCLASANEDGSIHLWETTLGSPEVQQQRATIQLVADLFRQLTLRANVLERLRTLPGMSRPRREEGIAFAQSYPENPRALNILAWDLVKLPGRELSGYTNALRYSKEACQLEPQNGDFLNTLGVAYYRVGSYEKALATLLGSDQIHQKQYKVSIPADLGFLAMTQQRLGHTPEAQAYLKKLQEGMKDRRWAQNAEGQGFLRETEALLAKPPTP
jgi:WD40 repeat protein/serine/threonine protein kinase